MRELTELELNAVTGAGIAYDAGVWLGERTAGVWNSTRAYVYNEPFRRLYRV